MHSPFVPAVVASRLTKRPNRAMLRQYYLGCKATHNLIRRAVKIGQTERSVPAPRGTSHRRRVLTYFSKPSKANGKLLFSSLLFYFLFSCCSENDAADNQQRRAELLRLKLDSQLLSTLSGAHFSPDNNQSTSTPKKKGKKKQPSLPFYMFLLLCVCTRCTPFFFYNSIMECVYR